MRFFSSCLPCRPSETGIISAPEKTSAIQQFDTKNQLSNRFDSSGKSINSDSDDVIYANGSKHSETAPNTPESFHDMLIVRNVTSTSSSSGPEFYVDDEDSSSKAEELNHLKSRLRALDEAICPPDDEVIALDVYSPRNDNDETEVDDDNDNDAIDGNNKGGDHPIVTAQHSTCDVDSASPTSQSSPIVNHRKLAQTNIQEKLNYFQREAFHVGSDDNTSSNHRHVDTTEEITESSSSSYVPAEEVSNGIPVKPSTKQSKGDRIVPRAKSAAFIVSRRPTRRSMRVIDCHGSEFEDAYKVWYLRGLLAFRPQSIPAPLIDPAVEDSSDEENNNGVTFNSTTTDELPKTKEAPVAVNSFRNYDDNKRSRYDETSGSDSDEENDSSPIDRSVEGILARNVFGSFRATKNVEPAYLHFSDSFDDSSRSESFRKSRTVPISTLFGDTRDGSSSHKRKAPMVSLFSEPKPASAVAKPITPASPPKLTPPSEQRTDSDVPISTAYQSYLNAYKDHVAARKSKLGKS